MKKTLGTCRGGIPAAVVMLLVACTSDRFSSGEPEAGTADPASDDTAGDDTASDETASDETASDEAAGDDSASDGTRDDSEGGDDPSGSGVLPPGQGGQGGAPDASMMPNSTDDGPAQGDDAAGQECSEDECVRDDETTDSLDAGSSVPGDLSDASLDPPPADADGPGADAQDASAGAAADASMSPEESGSSPPEASAPIEAAVPDAGIDAAVNPDEAGESFTCPSESERGPRDRCYYFGSQEVDWEQARELCVGRGQGWDLATPSEAEEDAWISERLEDDAWIGASDAEETDVWRWVDDGTVFWVGKQDGAPHDGAYTNWWDSGPSDTDDIEQCARYTLREEAWYWADIPCSRDYLYVCEWAPSE